VFRKLKQFRQFRELTEGHFCFIHTKQYQTGGISIRTALYSEREFAVGSATMTVVLELLCRIHELTIRVSCQMEFFQIFLSGYEALPTSLYHTHT